MRTLKLLALVALFLGINVATNLVMNPPTAAGPPDCVPGDIDGDGAVLINDAVALLSYLFQQGDPPVACAQPPQLSADEVALLQEVLPHLSIEYLDDLQGGTVKTVRFTGVNLQIVNGLGATNGDPANPNLAGVGEVITNGLGNLLVGYLDNSDLQCISSGRTGSHNLIVGSNNSWQGVGCVVAGRANCSFTSYAAVLGGEGNFTTNNPYGSVVGGSYNIAGGQGATLVGGIDNGAFGNYATVAGGTSNNSDRFGCTVLGGQGNVAGDFMSADPFAGQGATAVGGQGNAATGEHSTVGGGLNRSATGDHDWVAGSLFEDQ